MLQVGNAIHHNDAYWYRVSNDADVPTGPPFTFLSLARLGVLEGSSDLASLNRGSGNHFYLVQPSATATRLRLRTRAGSLGSITDRDITCPMAGWRWSCASLAANDDWKLACGDARARRLLGTGQGNDSYSTPSAIDTFNVGKVHSGAPDNYPDEIAFVALWSEVLSMRLMRQLVTGVWPENVPPPVFAVTAHGTTPFELLRRRALEVNGTHDGMRHVPSRIHHVRPIEPRFNLPAAGAGFVGQASAGDVQIGTDAADLVAGQLLGASAGDIQVGTDLAALVAGFNDAAAAGDVQIGTDAAAVIRGFVDAGPEAQIEIGSDAATAILGMIDAASSGDVQIDAPAALAQLGHVLAAVDAVVHILTDPATLIIGDQVPFVGQATAAGIEVATDPAGALLGQVILAAVADVQVGTDPAASIRGHMMQAAAADLEIATAAAQLILGEISLTLHDRIITVRAQDRTITVDTQDRTIVVEKQDRTGK